MTGAPNPFPETGRSACVGSPRVLEGMGGNDYEEIVWLAGRMKMAGIGTHVTNHAAPTRGLDGPGGLPDGDGETVFAIAVRFSL